MARLHTPRIKAAPVFVETDEGDNLRRILDEDFDDFMAENTLMVAIECRRQPAYLD